MSITSISIQAAHCTFPGRVAVALVLCVSRLAGSCPARRFDKLAIRCGPWVVACAHWSMRFWAATGLVLLSLAGCGSSTEGDNAVQPDVVADTLTTSEASPPSSEPVTASMSYDAVDDAIPMVEFEGDLTDVPAPYFGSQSSSGGAAEPVDGFAPASEDQEFCWAIETINSRPQPRDEFQEIVVANGYFSAIQPFAGPVVMSELDVLIGFTNTIVEQGSFTEADEVDGGAIATAFQSINTFVDERCLGIS